MFQAIRPEARSLATTMGRGGTRRAAIASALMEAIETHVAETIAGGPVRTLAELGEAALGLWHRDARDPLAVRLAPAVPRRWIDGVDLATGAARLVPFDLVSQDLTGPAMPDTLTSTVGLASGGSRDEALASALAELLEHDLESDWRRAPAGERRRGEIDPGSVTDPAVRDALDRIGRAGCGVRLWSLGQDWGIAAILCFLLDGDGSATRLPPVGGGGCHPDRAIAALRAIQEAAQARAALISGARDDLSADHYAEPRAKAVELLLSSLCFGPGPLAWRSVPTVSRPGPAQALAAVAAVARARSPLPLIAVTLPSPHPSLHIVKVAAPGLRMAERGAPDRPPEPAGARAAGRPRRGRRLLFVGPSLWKDELPPGIERHPPAAAGDLARLLADPPEMVGLVDGRFETAPSVWHKEILDLLAAGVAVLGAGSLGALRAAELHGHEMVGIGRVFAAYRDGRVRRDDAVMLVHAPAELGFRPLTVALVDAEAAIARVVADAAERRLLQRIARTMPFRERTWPAMLERYRARAGRPCTVVEERLITAASLKRHDARLLVRAMGRPPVPVASCPRPPVTSYYRRMLART